MSNIILIGMPASGKSTLGVILAKTLGMDFIDTDLLIQNHQKMLLQEIIDNSGLEVFLKAEESVILSLNCQNSVVATGGSAVLSSAAMAHLKSTGKIVYLKTDYHIIESRLNNIETRGIARKSGESIKDILEYRQPLYEKYADITVEILNFNIEKTVSIIVKKIKL